MNNDPKLEENMRNINLKFMVLVTILALATPALAVDFGLRGYYWVPGMEGDVRVDDDDITGTKIDFKSDLGVNEESYPMIEAFAGVGKHNLSITYYNVKYEGDKELNQTIVFNGTPYQAFERVVSKFSYSTFDFTYRYTLLDLENFLAGGSIGALGKLKYMDGLVSIESETADKQEQEFKAPIPMVGAHVHVGLLVDILEFRAQLAGIGYGDTSVYEAFADVSLTPFPFLDIHAGYRAFVLDVDEDDIEINFDTTGPYIGISVGF